MKYYLELKDIHCYVAGYSGTPLDWTLISVQDKYRKEFNIEQRDSDADYVEISKKQHNKFSKIFNLIPIGNNS